MSNAVATPAVDELETEKPVKRSRGRPKKYANPEEQQEARRAQILQSVRKYRQKQAETRKSTSEGSSTNTVTTPEDESQPDRSEDVLAVVKVVPRKNSTKSTTLAKVTHPPVDDGHDELAIATARYHQYQPADLTMRNSSLFVEGLVADFLTTTQNSETWWPFSLTTKLPGFAGQLVDRAHVAGCASTLAVAKNDPKLMKIGDAANIDTIRLLRHYTRETHVKQLALPLIIMTYQLINYEFKEFYRGEDTVPTTMTWALHGQASNTIAFQAGPDAFRSGLGTRILLGLLPQAVMSSVGMRIRLTYADAPWLSMLEGMKFPAFKESIWPLGVHVPGLMEEYDMIMADSEAIVLTSHRLQDLYMRLKRLDGSFDKWLTLYPDGKGSMADLKLWWSSNTKTAPTDVFFPKVMFASICAAQVMLLYWTLKLLLAILAADIQDSFASINGISTSPLIPHEPAVKYADLICRSNDYFLRAHNLSANTMYNCVSWPLRVAWRWFHSQGIYPEEAEWCSRISRGLRYDKVGKVGEYVVDFAYGPPPRDISSEGLGMGIR